MSQESKALNKNGCNEGVTAEGELEWLSPEERSSYRALSARINYLAQGSPCVQFSAKEVCRRMLSPSSRDFQRLKKLARFLVGLKEVKIYYEWQSESEARELMLFVEFVTRVPTPLHRVPAW